MTWSIQFFLSFFSNFSSLQLKLHAKHDDNERFNDLWLNNISYLSDIKNEQLYFA